jgi:hypothetical protein
MEHNPAQEDSFMATNELERFLKTWDRETEGTLKLLRALPPTQYDFRPDAGGRSLGELAWHLAEGDAYMSQWWPPVSSIWPQSRPISNARGPSTRWLQGSNAFTKMRWLESRS